MPQWLRNAIMLVVLTAWTAFIVSALIRGTTIDAIAWGVPGALYLAMNPPKLHWSGGDPTPPDSQPPPEEPAATGGGGSP